MLQLRSDDCSRAATSSAIYTNPEGALDLNYGRYADSFSRADAAEKVLI